MERLIPGYHFNTSRDISDPEVILTKEEFRAGTYWRMGIFSEFVVNHVESSALGESEVFKVIPGDPESGVLVNPAFGTPSVQGKFFPLVVQRFNQIIREEVAHLEEMIISIEENEKGEVVSSTLFDPEFNIRFPSKKHAVVNYVINSFYAGYFEL